MKVFKINSRYLIDEWRGGLLILVGGRALRYVSGYPITIWRLEK